MGRIMRVWMSLWRKDGAGDVQWGGEGDTGWGGGVGGRWWVVNGGGHGDGNSGVVCDAGEEYFCLFQVVRWGIGLGTSCGEVGCSVYFANHRYHCCH